MKKTGSKITKERYIFRSEHFYRLLDNQKYLCPYSGRELTPANCIAEHVIPLRKGGSHKEENIILVDNHVGYLKRYLKDEEVVKLAIEIVSTLGKNHGITLRKRKV